MLLDQQPAHPGVFGGIKLPLQVAVTGGTGTTMVSQLILPAKTHKLIKQFTFAVRAKIILNRNFAPIRMPPDRIRTVGRAERVGIAVPIFWGGLQSPAHFCGAQQVIDLIPTERVNGKLGQSDHTDGHVMRGFVVRAQLQLAVPQSARLL